MKMLILLLTKRDVYLDFKVLLLDNFSYLGNTLKYCRENFKISKQNGQFRSKEEVTFHQHTPSLPSVLLSTLLDKYPEFYA